MAYVSVSEWRPEQVTEWLKGLDNSVSPYIHWFSNNEVDGQQLLNLSPDELTHLGVNKVGHQELILEAVQHLRNFHYDLDRENLQLLALGLSCASHSLYNEVKEQSETSTVTTQIMADVANIIHFVKTLVSWLDRPPFAGQLEYSDYKSQLLSLSLEMATCALRGRFAERPVTEIRICSSKLAKLSDSIIQDISDPMLLQPATLDLATVKKRAGEDLGFFIVPSFHGVHQIGEMKLSSPLHQSGKIQEGDEIVQVNYQTIVGWSRKKVMALFEESPNDLLLTLKRRPRHVKMYGQIYMKPYRLPSRKRASPYSRWNDSIPSPRPELLTIPDFDIPRPAAPEKKKEVFLDHALLESLVTSSSSDEECCQPLSSQSPTSMRIYLPKPRAPLQRRFTLSGPIPSLDQAGLNVEQFWRELQLEKSWLSSKLRNKTNTGSQNITVTDRNHAEDVFQLRDKSASFSSAISTPNRQQPELVEQSGTSDKKLTRSEINKLKRDAFFNNMKCTSEVGEEVAAAKPPCVTGGKVLKLIGNFERKGSLRNKNNTDPIERERGRLDKSHSTPAYDLVDITTAADLASGGTEQVTHGQMVNTINNYLLPDGDFYGKLIPLRKYEDKCTQYEDTESVKKNKRAGEISDTVNLALIELNEREESECRKYEDSPLPVVAKRTNKDPSPPPLKERKRIDEKRPVPLERKLKPDLTKNTSGAAPVPLPPKPKPKLTPLPLPRSPEPPEPPPRPESSLVKKQTVVDEEREPVPVLNVLTEKQHKSASGTLESLKAIFVRKPSSFNSPKTVRKKNDVLAKRRNIAVKDVTPCDYQGVLWHRHRKGSSMAQWTEAYFALQGSTFYGFKTKNSLRADLFLHLPGFTCTTADEVKSKRFAFKIYHIGTVFYFAAKCEEELQQWLDCIQVATVVQDEKHVPDTLTFSETDSEKSDDEVEQETCFPTSPKMKKFLGSSPKPATSHQNLATDSKKSYETGQKMFGSLKKFTSPKHSSDNSQLEVASLDRKYLKFLTQKNTPVPVRTSQFRSYRRMDAAGDAPIQTKSNVNQDVSPLQNLPRNNVVTHLHPRDQPRLARGMLHASNPSLIHSDMADYRITQERLKEFGRVRNENRQDDMSSFVTLEQFMLYQQEEERMMRSHRPSRSRVYPVQSEVRRGVSSHSIQCARPNLPPKPVALSSSEEPISQHCEEGNSYQFETSCDASSRYKDVSPDYPGIEYPPVFEPETYTLTEAQLNRNKKKRDGGSKKQ